MADEKDHTEEEQQEQNEQFAALIEREGYQIPQIEQVAPVADVSDGDSGQLTPLDTPGMDPKKRNWKSIDQAHSSVASVDESANQWMNPEEQGDVDQTTQGFENNSVAHQYKQEQQSRVQVEQPEIDERPNLEEITREDWTVELEAKVPDPEPKQSRDDAEMEAVLDQYAEAGDHDQSQEKEQDRDEPER